MEYFADEFAERQKTLATMVRDGRTRRMPYQAMLADYFPAIGDLSSDQTLVLWAATNRIAWEKSWADRRHGPSSLVVVFHPDTEITETG